MVHFVPLFKPAQNRNCILDARRSAEDRLEAAFERCILFDMLAVFIERRCADSPKLASSQRWLEEVGRIHRSFCSTCSDERMQFIYKKDNFAFRFDNLAYYRFEALFELAAEFAACNEGPQVKRKKLLILEAVWHVARNDALGQPFDDSGFPYARLSDEHGIVFSASREHLHDTADLLVPSNDRIELAGSRKRREIPRIFLEHLVLFFGVLV